ncbi:unnamed protein product [Onchocerca flexuosa]|uniref:Phage protein n=1 Tax=Onchocerca flexuosa TaxID=387005 RepID=A0A183HL71_9BILA|nr:unnamed protein product [Onchocerca flexuosa]
MFTKLVLITVKATLQKQSIFPKKIDEAMVDIGDAISTAKDIQYAYHCHVPMSDGDELNKDFKAELNATSEYNSEISLMSKEGLSDVPREEFW